jgi:hypothetical protein
VTLQARFFAWLYNFIIKPKTASPSSRITVYLKKKKRDYDEKTMKATFNAFKPREYDHRLETSVFDTEGMLEEKVWRLGHLWTVINPRPYKSGQENIKARGDFLAGVVLNGKSLKLAVDPSPHPKHHNILGWPADQTAQELAALELIVETTVTAVPKPIS